MNAIAQPYQRLFTRKPDRKFFTFDDLYTESLREKDCSLVRWVPSANVYVAVHEDRMKLKLTGDRAYDLTDWSFSQLCNYVQADRKIIERLKLETASQVLSEVFPVGDRPLQVFTTDNMVRSLHRISYERLFNSNVLDVVLDEAMHLTGKYGEVSAANGFFSSDRDMHAFFVDESAWTYYWDEKLAPAFVVWNSEVGACSVGIRAGWYHAATNGFILYGSSCPMSYSRRHSRGVNDALNHIRERIQIWHQTADEQSDLLMKKLTWARTEIFAPTNNVLHRKLVEMGLPSEQARSVDKWLITTGRSFSRLDVAVATSAVSSTSPFAANRLKLGQVAGDVLGLGVKILAPVS
jgi:hypothetical protein